MLLISVLARKTNKTSVCGIGTEGRSWGNIISRAYVLRFLRCRLWTSICPLAGIVPFVERLPFAQGLPCHTEAPLHNNRVYRMTDERVDCKPLSSYVLRNGFGESGNYTLFGRVKCLSTQLLCELRHFLMEKTILEFGNSILFAGCGCIPRLLADSLRRTQSADCQHCRTQDYIA